MTLELDRTFAYKATSQDRKRERCGEMGRIEELSGSQVDEVLFEGNAPGMLVKLKDGRFFYGGGALHPKDERGLYTTIQGGYFEVSESYAKGILTTLIDTHNQNEADYDEECKKIRAAYNE